MEEFRVFETIPAASWWAERNIDAGDQVALLTSTTVDPRAVESLQTAAAAVGADVTKVTGPSAGRSGSEPSPIVAAAIDAADVVVNCSASYGFSEPIIEFIRRGGRHLKVYASVDAFVDGAVEVYHEPEAFEEMRRNVIRYAEALTNADHLKVTSPLGTDISASLANRTARRSFGVASEQHGHTAYPTGETDVPPVEGSAQGRAFIDITMAGVGRVDEPIEITVEDGIAVDFAGGTAARRLEELIESHEPACRNIAEFGFGMNPFAKITGDKNNDKKISGSGHIALGDNRAFKTLSGDYGMPGGVSASLHLDGILRSVSLYLDDEPVIEGGEFLL